MTWSDWQRVVRGRATPRDLVALSRTLALLPRIKARLTAVAALSELEAALGVCLEVRSSIDARWSMILPCSPRKGPDPVATHLSSTSSRGGSWRKVVDRQVPGRTGPADRHSEPQGGIQQSLRILHRDHPCAGGEGPSGIHSQADGQECRAVHHSGTERVRGQSPACRGPGLRARVRALHRAPGPGRR